MSVRRYILLFIAVLTISAGRFDKQIDIRGVYGHPQAFWDRGYKLNDLNVNAVFLHHKSITDSFMDRARAEKLSVFAEFATLNGKGYVEQHPEAWAIDKNGDKVEKATWFMGVCPTDSGFLDYRITELKSLLKNYDVDGVWLDYLHWHAQFEDPEPILPETCFNNSCIEQFAKESRIRIQGTTIKQRAAFILKNHERKWRAWRAKVIAGWVKTFQRSLKEEKPDGLLGVYHCPWDDNAFDSARFKILGLDYALLKNEVDVFSPMVYHKRMGKDAHWVKENIQWFSDKINGSNAKIWPIVQAYNDPGTISPAEFEIVLRNGIAGNASGVMMFTSSSVAEDSLKILVMKKVFGEWRQGERLGRHWVKRSPI